MMSDTIDYKTQKKREYHREWRKNHQESVKAAQMRYWSKKIEAAAQNQPSLETRSEED